MNMAPEHLEIEYPCLWQYRLIGEDEDRLRAALAECVDPARCTIGRGHVSTGGHYLSLVVDLTVDSEEERLRLYQKLAAHPHIRMVL